MAKRAKKTGRKKKNVISIDPKLLPEIDVDSTDVNDLIERALIDKIKKCLESQGGLDVAGVKALEILRKIQAERALLEDKTIDVCWDTIAVEDVAKEA